MSHSVYLQELCRAAGIFQRSSATIGSKLDAFFSCAWWWRARRYLAERRLGQALDRFGDKSIAARWETEQYRRMQFAVMYWRSAPAPVRKIALAAHDAGLPEADLRLNVLNTDLRIRNSKVFLRRSTLVRVLSAAFATIVGAHWTLMYGLAVIAPGPFWLKILVIVGIFVIYAAMYRGWSLYAYRALAAIDRSGDELDRVIAKAPYRATINPLSIARL